MKKITYHIAILITLLLSALPSAKADLGDSPEKMNEKWGEGKEGKAGGTHDFKTLTWKKEGVELKAYFTFQNKCFKMEFFNCPNRAGALKLLKEHISVDFKFQHSLRDDDFRGTSRNNSKDIKTYYIVKQKKLTVKDDDLFLKTRQIGKPIKKEDILLPSSPLLGETLEKIEAQFPGGKKSKTEEGVTTILWGKDIYKGDWGKQNFQVEASFTPISNLCYCLQIRKGIMGYCISKEEALLIAEILLPDTPLNIINNKKDINSFKGEATLKNEAKRIAFRYQRDFSKEFFSYREDSYANLTLYSQPLGKQRGKEVRKLRQGK